MVCHWQSAPGSSPSAAADYLYDGSGNRVEQADTSSGTSTQVYDLFGGLEEVSSTGGTSTLTKYYSVGGLLIGEKVGGTISYLASDGLGSVSEALSTSGTATATQLFGPYGGVRYSSGTMPTAKGFTGQRADAISGLDYYNARYYDPVLGQFASADTKQGPNRFAYVADDPETLTDPSGQLRTCMDPQDGCGGGGGGSCHSDGSCGCYTSCGGPPPGTPPPCNAWCHHHNDNNPHGGCASCGNDGGNKQGSGAPLTDPATIYSTCSQAGGHPGWCSRYYDYSNGIAIPKAGDLIASADYYWIQVAFGNVEFTLYIIRATGEVLGGFGAALGLAVGLFGGVVVAAGFGVLDAEGTPSAQQVRDFLKGYTTNVTFAPFVDLGVVGNPSGGWAEQEGAATGVVVYAAGLEYTFDQQPNDQQWSDPIPMGGDI